MQERTSHRKRSTEGESLRCMWQKWLLPDLRSLRTPPVGGRNAGQNKMTATIQSVTLTEQPVCVTQFEAECIIQPAMTDMDIDLPGVTPCLIYACKQVNKGKYTVQWAVINHSNTDAHNICKLKQKPPNPEDAIQLQLSATYSDGCVSLVSVQHVLAKGQS